MPAGAQLWSSFSTRTSNHRGEVRLSQGRCLDQACYCFSGRVTFRNRHHGMKHRSVRQQARLPVFNSGFSWRKIAGTIPSDRGNEDLAQISSTGEIAPPEPRSDRETPLVARPVEVVLLGAVVVAIPAFGAKTAMNQGERTHSHAVDGIPNSSGTFLDLN